MISESLGNFRISDVRLVRLMSKWENPTFVLQRYTLFYYFQTFCNIFLENFAKIKNIIIKTAKMLYIFNFFTNCGVLQGQAK